MWSTSSAIQNIRQFYKMNQQQFADRIGISKTYISLIEAQKKSPSQNVLNKINQNFSVNIGWLVDGKDEPFKDTKKNRDFIVHIRRPKSQKVLLAASALASPFMPALTAGLALGVTADAIINKMQKAYEAKDEKALAHDIFDIDQANITRWKKNNHVPEKYIKKTASDTGQPETYIKLDDSLVDELIDSMTDFVQEQFVFFESKQFDRDVCRENFLKKFGLEEW